MRATLLALLALSNPFSNCVTSGVSPATCGKTPPDRIAIADTED
jgi:hypothetical protein